MVDSRLVAKYEVSTFGEEIFSWGSNPPFYFKQRGGG
jgi:hypothetical protein